MLFLKIKFTKFFLTFFAFGLQSIISQTAWTENSFDDFRDGTFLDAGSNIYVSANGRMQMITRWDFNNDGNLDIFLPGSHGHTEKENVFIYLNNGKDVDGRSRIELPAAGASDGLVADFNKDGFNDLALVHYSDSHFKRVAAWIYLGSADGFSVNNRIELPSAEGSAIACGDFNNDSWIDIVIACQYWENNEDIKIEARKSFIYWNSNKGFDSQNRLAITFNGKGVKELSIGDIDGDNTEDLIAMSADNTYLFLSSKKAFENINNVTPLNIVANSAGIGDLNNDGNIDAVFSTKNGIQIYYGFYNNEVNINKSASIKVSKPSDVEVEDINNDNYDDVIVSNFASPGGATWTNSFVYISGSDGINESNKIELPTIGASAVSCEDLDNDGYKEIVFSFERVTNQKNILSYIYWNDNGTFRYENHTQLPTLGSMSNACGDVNNDGLIDVVFFNDEGYFRDGPTESPIYWGDGTRNFDPLRKTVFNTHQIFGFGHADLNDDTNVDIILAQKNFIYGVSHEQGGVIIHWGDDGNFNPPTHLTMEYAYGGVRVADINRDGYLDILAGGYATDIQDPTKHGFPIFWGSENGYSFRDRQLLHYSGKRFRAPLLMDVNKDNFLDIVGQVEDGEVRIWWGSTNGFSDENHQDIDLGRKDHLMYIKGADFNKDGWLDLVFPQRGSPDGTKTSSFIYYGSDKGYNNENRDEVYSFVPYQNTISDLNKDGWLDLVLTSYGGEVSGNRPSLIYYGSHIGFSKEPTKLETYGSSGSEALDYDNDGWLDLLFSNHRQAGSYLEAEPHKHIVPQLLYWGSPDGYSKENRMEMVAVGTSGLNLRDLGNSYDRGLYEEYISSIYQNEDNKKLSSINWKAETPFGTSVKFQLRAGDSKSEIEQAKWIGQDGTDTWFTKSGSQINSVQGKYLQYRVHLITPDGAATPYLSQVQIKFEK